MKQQQQLEMQQAVQESQVAKNAAPAAKVLMDGAEQPQRKYQRWTDIYHTMQ